jgi:hypothetical protein
VSLPGVLPATPPDTWRYAPPSSSGADVDFARTWYEPGSHLNQRSVILEPGIPGVLSGGNQLRKFASMVNNDPAITVYIGDSSQVTAGAGPFAGSPLLPRAGMTFDAHEYIGDVWGVIPAGAANAVDVRVMDPTAGN